mgnify:CR=1 FL=1
MSISVLIVDDHAVMAEGLRALIDAQPDLAVTGCVTDGRAALHHVVELLPDVVLCQVHFFGPFIDTAYGTGYRKTHPP